MNIFVLDLDPQKAAQYHNSTHVRKMILETAQILSTALRENGVTSDLLYKSTHKNHPCVLACKNSHSNFGYTLRLGLRLAQEFEYRFGKEHKSKNVLEHICMLLHFIPEGNFNLPQCMPEEYKSNDIVRSYRTYYLKEKVLMKNGKRMDDWGRRGTPKWWSQATERTTS